MGRAETEVGLPMNTSQASEGNTIRAIDMAPAPFIKPPRQLSGAYTKDLGLGARDCVRSSPSRASGTGSFAGTRDARSPGRCPRPGLATAAE